MCFRYRWLMVLLMPLLLMGCAGEGFSSQSTQNGDIRYYYNNLFQRYDVLMEITEAGDITINQRKGPEDTDRRQVHGHLTAEQKTLLLAAFKGWKDLKPEYPGDWTATIQITFDDYKVQANSSEHIPSGFKRAQAALEKVLHESLPPWPASSTQPTTSPAAGVAASNP